jgi:hypothetical protein
MAGVLRALVHQPARPRRRDQLAAILALILLILGGALAGGSAPIETPGADPVATEVSP